MTLTMDILCEPIHSQNLLVSVSSNFVSQLSYILTFLSVWPSTVILWSWPWTFCADQYSKSTGVRIIHILQTNCPIQVQWSLCFSTIPWAQKKWSHVTCCLSLEVQIYTNVGPHSCSRGLYDRLSLITVVLKYRFHCMSIWPPTFILFVSGPIIWIYRLSCY